MKKCKEKSKDCTSLIPSSRFLGELQELLERGPMSFDRVIELIGEKVSSAISCDLCVEAFKEVYKVPVACEEAKKTLLRQLAGWYVEMLEALGYVKVKYAWKP